MSKYYSDLGVQITLQGDYESFSPLRNNMTWVEIGEVAEGLKKIEGLSLTIENNPAEINWIKAATELQRVGRSLTPDQRNHLYVLFKKAGIIRENTDRLVAFRLALMDLEENANRLKAADKRQEAG